MTYQEAEKLIDEMDKAFRIGLIKVIILVLVGAILLVFLVPFLEKVWEDFVYWLDCKKWDREHKGEQINGKERTQRTVEKL